MGLFDFFRRPKPVPHNAPPAAPKQPRDLEADIQTAVDLLRPHLLPTCFGVADESGGAAAIHRSKLGGEPYAEAGETWPIHADSGRAMVFVCQVNRSDLPAETAFPSGLVVVFADSEEMYNCDLRSGDGTLVIRYYQLPDEAKYVRLEKPSSDERFEEIGERRLNFRAGSSLPDGETIASLEYRDKYGAIKEWSRAVGLYEWRAPFREAKKQLGAEPPSGSVIQIGGHPQWLQGAEPPDEGQLPHERFLMQINSGEDLGVTWYDDGSVYVYGEAVSLKPDYAIFQCT